MTNFAAIASAIIKSERSSKMLRLRSTSAGPTDALPTEFRLFVKGWNETENGNFLFDDAAAKQVLAAHRKWGVDLMIDLEHQSLDPSIAPDPTAKDARGWCTLELREDGSLWAVQVKWTADGAKRLSEKRQRYVSPAFHVDPETKRVSAIINVAITAIPATHDTPALVAASTKGTRGMNRISRLAADTSALPGANTDADPAADTKLRAIAKTLGIEPTDARSILDAVAALVIDGEGTEPAGEEAPATDAEAAKKLTPAQLKACRDLGCTPANFLALQRQRVVARDAKGDPIQTESFAPHAYRSGRR